MDVVDQPRRAGERPAAVLLDALGTLVRLDRPFERLAAQLARRGAPVGVEAAAAALREEMRFYRAEHHRAVDRRALEALRDDCARVLGAALPAAVTGVLGHEAVRAAMLAALRFEAFPEVPAVLGELRAAGHPLMVVSNWDVSLHDVLAGTGLAPLVDGVLTSAEHGAAKPAPGLFERALARVGRPPDEAVHVGDSVVADVAGAAGAGIAAVLLDREGMLDAPPGVVRAASLAEVPALVRGRSSGAP